MLSKGNQPRQKKLARLVMWLMLMAMLSMTVLRTGNQIELQASDTAFAVAEKRILERANFYRQHWILAGQPQHLEIQQKFIQFTSKGWPMPLNSQSKIDCEYWIDLLYPQTRVLDTLPTKISDNSEQFIYQCHYFYGDETVIFINLSDEKFNVSVNSLLKPER